MSTILHPSEASIQRELEAYPDACLDRRNVAIERIRGRRAAIIELHRTRKAMRRYAERNRDTIDAEWEALETPPLTISDHIAAVRARVGDEQWDTMRGEGL